MKHRVLAIVALVAGVLAAFAGSPYREVESTSGRGGSGHRARDLREVAIPGAEASPRQPLDDSPVDPKTRTLVHELATTVAREEDHLTALELAAWIRDRKPGLRIIDLRSQAEFDAFHLPGAQRILLEELPSASFRSDETIVLLSEGGAHAAQAWVFLRALGRREVYFLRGGVAEWIADVRDPVKPSELTRYFGRGGC